LTAEGGTPATSTTATSTSQADGDRRLFTSVVSESVLSVGGGDGPTTGDRGSDDEDEEQQRGNFIVSVDDEADVDMMAVLLDLELPVRHDPAPH